MTGWTPRPAFTRRFWVGCAIIGLSFAFLVASLISLTRSDADTLPQVIFAAILLLVGARIALSGGNAKALMARFR